MGYSGFQADVTRALQATPDPLSMAILARRPDGLSGVQEAGGGAWAKHAMTAMAAMIHGYPWQFSEESFGNILNILCLTGSHIYPATRTE